MTTQTPEPAADSTQNVEAASDDPDPARPGPTPVRALGPHVFLSPEQVVERALFLARAGKDELIDVAGPDGLAAMVSLCRAGYARVELARQATCGGADEAGDVLLIVGPMSAEALAATIVRTTRLLRDDGALIVQLADAGAESAVGPALTRAGFEATFTLVDRAAGRLVLHRLRRRALALRKIA